MPAQNSYHDRGANVIRGKTPPASMYPAARLRPAGVDNGVIRPFVGVAHTDVEASPCAQSLLPQVVSARAGIEAGGGTSREFSTISISDVLTQNHEDMRFSLMSREAIADSVEIVVRAQNYDALLGIGACDKTIPGLLMAMVRLNVPSIFLHGGAMLVGEHEGAEVNPLRNMEGVDCVHAGEMTVEELEHLDHDLVTTLVPCAAPISSGTGGFIAETLGFAPLGSTTMPAAYVQRQAIARRAGQLLMNKLRAGGPLPRELVTRQSLENAAAVVAATGGTTNSGLHLPAIAHEAGIRFTLSEMGKVFRRTPTLAALAPAGPYLPHDLHRIGGTPAVLKELLDGGFLHGDALTADGSSLADALFAAPPPDGKIVLTCAEPIRAGGGWSY